MEDIRDCVGRIALGDGSRIDHHLFICKGYLTAGCVEGDAFHAGMREKSVDFLLRGNTVFPCRKSPGADERIDGNVEAVFCQCRKTDRSGKDGGSIAAYPIGQAVVESVDLAVLVGGGKLGVKLIELLSSYRYSGVCRFAAGGKCHVGIHGIDFLCGRFLRRIFRGGRVRLQTAAAQSKEKEARQQNRKQSGYPSGRSAGEFF